MPFPQKPTQFSEQEILHSLRQDGVDRKRGEELLFSQYAYLIKQGVYKYSFSEEEAFSTYSDTIIAIIPQLSDGSFEGRSSLKTWINQVFHNKCVDLIRKKTTIKNSIHRTTALPDLFSRIADSAKSVLQEMVDQADREKIRQKLNELGENCRQLLMHWAEGVSDKEIAVVMEYKTADVVKTSRLRCLEKLRQLYKSSIK